MIFEQSDDYCKTCSLDQLKAALNPAKPATNNPAGRPQVAKHGSSIETGTQQQRGGQHRWSFSQISTDTMASYSESAFAGQVEACFKLRAQLLSESVCKHLTDCLGLDQYAGWFERMVSAYPVLISILVTASMVVNQIRVACRVDAA